MVSKSNNFCVYKPKKILTEDKAKKCKIGTYYHPTKTTYRSGACKKGEILKKGYIRKTYIKKNGTKVHKAIVTSFCVKDTGKSGQTISEYKVIKINKHDLLAKYGYNTKISSKERFNALIKASSHYTYATVFKRLNAIRTLSKANKRLFDIYTTDLNNMKLWRIKNPDKYKTKTNTKITSKKVSSKKITGKKATSKKATSKKATSKKVTAKKATAKKATSKKVTAKKETSKKATSKKATSKKATSKKATSKKATSKKAISKKATSKKATLK